MTEARGLLHLGRLDAGSSAEVSLPPGRWALHTQSTVPYLEITAGKEGRTLTWGEALDLSQTGQIKNASAHAGDVWLAPATEKIVPARPAAYTLPALFTQSTVAGLPVLTTQWIDTRGVRAAFLAYLPAPNLLNPFQVSVEQRGNRGLFAAPGSSAAVQGALVYTKSVPGTARLIAFGIGIDDAVPDNRPGIFQDSARMILDANAGTEAYIVIAFA